MEFAAARKALAEDSRELDLLQRELSLKQEQYYQDPTVAMKQQNNREDVDKAQSDIAAKKQDVEKDKQVLADLQDALRKAGGNAGWAEESANSGSSGRAQVRATRVRATRIPARRAVGLPTPALRALPITLRSDGSSLPDRWSVHRIDGSL